MTDGVMMKELEGLTEQERQVALQILKEYSTEGKSETYDDLIKEDFKEIPVDIETFLTDDNYMGKAWKENGKLKVYPFWLEQLKKLFPNNVDTAYNILLETGARGIGKSEIACGIVAPYLLYRILCLKDPRKYYGIKVTEKIVFAFMNIKLALTEKIALDKFQKNIQLSPWFMSRGSMTTYNNEPYWIPPSPIELIIGSQPDDVIGLPCFFAFFDEISFIRNQDIDKQKQKAKDMIDTARGGMVTRFIVNGKNPTVLAVASSKRSEQSFMEHYIKVMSETDSDNILIVDKPVWEVKPEGTYGKGTFLVALGDKYHNNLILKDADDPRVFKDNGYRIIEVPLFFKPKFLEDLDRNLCDIAGISTASSSKFMSPDIVKACLREDYLNPFPDVLTVGDDPNDKAQYYNFFNINNIPSELKSKPLFVHLDMSLTGDMTGIAGVWIVGKKVSTDPENQSKDLQFRLAFSTSIKAPKGRQISFEKNRNFIRWLKSSGFKVRMVTSDTYQAYDLQQQLSAEGFECEILSVDRVKDGVCYPYQYLKSTLYEERFTMYKSDRLYDEFVDVERNINTGKVDHTPNFHKDALDAVCGATFTASKFAEEYAYDYGENLETALAVNEGLSYTQEQQQITVEFEKELQQLLDPITRRQMQESKKQQEEQKEELSKNIENNTTKSNIDTQDVVKPTQTTQSTNNFKPMDFGLGPRQTYMPNMLDQGILWW